MDRERSNPRKTEAPQKREAEGRGTYVRPKALWLGAGHGSMDMGFGGGPRHLEAHELLSWFFSRDGH